MQIVHKLLSPSYWVLNFRAHCLRSKQQSTRLRPPSQAAKRLPRKEHIVFIVNSDKEAVRWKEHSSKTELLITRIRNLAKGSPGYTFTAGLILGLAFGLIPPTSNTEGTYSSKTEVGLGHVIPERIPQEQPRDDNPFGQVTWSTPIPE